MRFNPFAERYLFHFHTPYTDGKVSLTEYATYARESGADTLITLEHIRREPSYDVGYFSAELMEAALLQRLNPVLGFECKVLPGGVLDIDSVHLARAAVIGIAEHSLPGDRSSWSSVLSSVIHRYPAEFPDKYFVWVHPGLWWRRNGLDPQREGDFLGLLTAAQQAGIFIEHNLRYSSFTAEKRLAVRPEFLVVGADAHTASDLKRWREMQ